jgi:Ca-activated chloride channel family protein
MRFLQPHYLYLLLLLVVLFPLWLFRVTRLRRARLLASAPVRNLSSPSSAFADVAVFLTAALALASLVLAAAQPQWVHRVINPQLKKMDLVFLIDTSPSMRAEDIRPSRLDRALEVIAGFCDRKPEHDRIGLVAFTGGSVVLSYLTEDPNNIRYYLNYLHDDRIQRLGTNIGRALTNGLTVLNKEKEINPPAAGNKRVFILISDGEDHGSELNNAVSNVKGAGIKVHTIAIGSERGAPIPVSWEQSPTRYLLDAKGEPVISYLDERTLRRLAEETGGGAYRAVTGNELPQMLTRIVDTEREIEGFRQSLEFRDLHQEFLFAAFGLLLTGILIRGARV